MKNVIGMTAAMLLVTAGTVNAEPVENVISRHIVLPASTVNLLDTIARGEEDTSKSSGVAQEDINIRGGIITRVVAEEAIVRKDPSPDADIINFIDKDLLVSVSTRIDNFYEVEVAGKTGYIYKEQLDEEALKKIPHTVSEEEEKIEEVEEIEEEVEVYLGEEIVEYAKQFLGNPYVYGGTSLTRGADCSGFTQQIMKNFGINIERVSRSQYAANGYKVSEANMLPGDLVFYGYNGYIDHVAIYAGNGKIIHASTAKTGIIMSNLRYGGKPIVGIKRVI